jgi:hypothetical protein
VLDTPPRGGVFLAPDGPHELSPDEQATREKYVKLALATFQQAIAAGFNDADQIREDDDLLPLRTLPEFQHLLEAMSPQKDAEQE